MSIFYIHPKRLYDIIITVRLVGIDMFHKLEELVFRIRCI